MRLGSVSTATIPRGSIWLSILRDCATLARTVRGARLALYPDAGHSFLFQDAAAFVPAVDEFLGPRR